MQEKELGGISKTIWNSDCSRNRKELCICDRPLVQDIPLRFPFLLLGDGPCAASWDRSQDASRPVQEKSPGKGARPQSGVRVVPQNHTILKGHASRLGLIPPAPAFCHPRPRFPN